MLHLEFLAKNALRKYPFKGLATLRAEDGRVLEEKLIVGCKLSTSLEHLKLYVSKIYVNGTYINVSVSAVGTGESIGVFSGTITKSFQTIQFQPRVPRYSGWLAIGQIEALKAMNGNYNFFEDSCPLEESVVIPVPRPAVTSINHLNKTAVGFLKFTYDNITEAIQAPTIDLDVTNKKLVESLNDQSSTQLNCPTNVITAINTVEPDDVNNIDIYGIAPVSISVQPGGLQISLVGLTAEDVCTNVNNNIPAQPAENPDLYPDFLTVTQPEWKSWPQFAGKV